MGNSQPAHDKSRHHTGEQMAKYYFYGVHKVVLHILRGRQLSGTY